MEDNQTDVIDTTETTVDAPSAENETTETTQEVTQDDSMSPAVKAVPYDRFAEVIKNKQQLEARVKELEGKVTPQVDAQPNAYDEVVKQQLDKYLKELGYVSKQELEQKDADQQLEKNIEQLSSKYDGKDGRPKFDKTKVLNYAADNLIGNLEVAYKTMNEASLMDWAIKQAITNSRGTKTETSDGSGSTQIGTTQDDLYKAAQNGDDEAMKILIKRAIS